MEVTRLAERERERERRGIDKTKKEKKNRSNHHRRCADLIFPVKIKFCTVNSVRAHPISMVDQPTLSYQNKRGNAYTPS